MSLVRGGWCVWLSLLLACILSLVSLPNYLIWLRPDWVLLVLVYWVIALDRRVAIGLAFFIGVLLDLLHYTLFGEHALALVVAIYIILKLRKKMRVYPIIQQALVIMVVSLFYKVIIFFAQNSIAAPRVSTLYWLSIAVNTLVWPLVLLMLRWARRFFRVRD